MKKNKLYLIISWVLVVIWMILIFNFSAVTGEKSTKSSIGIISKTIEISTNILYKVKIIKEPLNNKQVRHIADNLNYPFRKCMHITEYFILGILLCNALKISKAKNIYLLCMLIALLYSLTDEFHQLFTSRTGSIIDVLIDSVGIAFSLLLFYLISSYHEKNIKEYFNF